jgi:prepilin-type processing-associated H-X9-DG protein
VQAPARMIALGDTTATLPPDTSVLPTVTPADILWWSSPYAFPGAWGGPGVANWHGGGANILFCDGHVEYAKQSVWMEASTERRRLWNNDNMPHPDTWP